MRRPCGRRSRVPWLRTDTSVPPPRAFPGPARCWAQIGYDLVICDLNMPGESGMTLLEELDKSHREIAVLMVTGEDDPAIAHLASERGADGYMVKPFSRNELLIHVDCALEQARRRQGQRRLGDHSLPEARERATEVKEALMDVAERERLIDNQQAEMLRRLSEAVGQRDLETGAHIRRIGRNSALLARAYGIEEEEAVRAIDLGRADARRRQGGDPRLDLVEAGEAEPRRARGDAAARSDRPRHPCLLRLSATRPRRGDRRHPP